MQVVSALGSTLVSVNPVELSPVSDQLIGEPGFAEQRLRFIPQPAGSHELGPVWVKVTCVKVPPPSVKHEMGPGAKNLQPPAPIGNV